MSKQLRKKVEQLSNIQNPHKVRVLVLSEQRPIYSDFYFLSKFTQVIKIDLSHNKISSFPIGFTFKSFCALKILFLHYNKLNNLRALQPVIDNKNIEFLTLFGNPLEQTKTRHLMVNQISGLKMLDEKIVRMQERYPDIILRSQQFASTIKFPIVTVLESESSLGYLSGVIQQLTLIRCRYMDANPIIKIQRWFKKVLKNRKQKDIIQESDEHPLLTPEKRSQERERLITQKMQISKSSQEKVLSILKMNFQFFAMLRKKAAMQLYADRKFCIQNDINFQEIGNHYVCLCYKNTSLENKSFLQLIMKISQGFLIQKKGSENSMGLMKRYRIYNKYLKKKKSMNQKFPINQALQKKLEELSLRYENSLVKIVETSEVKFHLLKQSYMKLKESVNQDVHNFFPFCLQDSFERTVAAVGIQRAWRGYLVRKKINLYKIMNEKFAAIRIQRWVRSLSFKHRSMFYVDIRSSLKKENKKSITVQMNKLVELQKRYEQNQEGINFRLPDQKFMFNIRDGSQFCIELWRQNLLPMIIPEYMQEIKPIYFPEGLTAQQDGHLEDVINQKNKCSNNILSILFTQTTATYYWQRNSTKYVTIQYKTVQQTKIRKFLIALTSYRFKSKLYIADFSLDIPQQSVDINTRVAQQFLISSAKNKIDTQRIQISLKIKLFVSQLDYSEMVRIMLPEGRDKDRILSRKQQIQYENQSLVVSQLEGSVSGRNSEIDMYHNQKVGLKSLNRPLNNQILQLEREQRLVDGLKKSKQSARLFQEESIKDKTIDEREGSKISILEKYKKKIICSYQNEPQKSISQFDQIPLTNPDFQYKMSQLQKTKSLRPNKQTHQLSREFRSLNREYALELMKRNINTQLLDESPKHSYRYYNYDNEMPNTDRREERGSKGSYLELLKSQRKQKIKQLKFSHQSKLEANLSRKKQYLQKIKKQKEEDHEKNKTIISQNRLAAEIQNQQRHQRIRACFQKNKERNQGSLMEEKSLCGSIATNSPRSKFESEFVNRGNKSIKLEMIKFEKNRELEAFSLQNTKNILKTTRNMISQRSMASNEHPQPYKSKVLKKWPENFKTEIKEFSINIDQSFNIGLSDPFKDSLQKKGRDKKLRIESSIDRLSQNKKIYNKDPSRLLNQFEKEVLGQEQQKVIEDEVINKRKKKEKLKKVVHSVFPEEFYPLQEPQLMGFELPRINTKKK